MKYYVIDGNSLLFRAYFATSFTGNIMRTKAGFPTNAIFGFNNLIFKIASSLKEGEDRLIVCFDTGKKTFRHKEYPEYKAQRKETDVDLVAQIPVARDLLKAMNIFYYEVEGYEADDIAGTVAKAASKAGYEVYCYTSDKDYLQLIDNHITVRLIKKGLTDINDMTPITLKESFGLEPLQIIDFKGLMGDPSDNLKGIPGVGEKTAVKLLNEYGTLENIYEAMKTENSKLAEKIIANYEQGKMCKHLATISLDVPLPFNFEELTYRGYDYNTLSAFYLKYEFYSLIKKLDTTKVIQNEKEEINLTEEIENIVVTSLKDIKDPNYIIPFFDLNRKYNEGELVSLSFKSGNKIYTIKKDHFDDPYLLDYLKDERILKKTYDYKALKVSLAKLGIEVNGLGFDLTLGSYLINPSLINDALSIYGYYGINLYSKMNTSLLDDEELEVDEYIKMSYYLPLCEKKCLEELEKQNQLYLLNDIELPLCEVLSKMEIEGFPINEEVLIKLNEEYSLKKDALEKKIFEMTGFSFNINSPKQVADLLYNKLNLPGNRKESTSIEVLNELKNYHPVINLIIEYRKYSKLISTYSSGLLAYIKEDKKIHTVFNQSLTQTGRLSSSDPNLQNISTRTEEGKAIRKAFYYDDPNYLLLSLDYSQVELRVLASMSKCQDLIDVFNKGGDIHEATAMKVFKLNKEDVTLDIRRKAKAVNFGIIYGISDWGLSEQISSSPSEAKAIIQSFYENYPDISDYFKKTISEAKEKGYCSTMYGRRRFIPELSSPNYMTREFGKRVAMNAPIQGTAADIMKICMIKVDKFLKDNNYKTKIVLQIHDELIFKVPLEEKDFIVSKLKEVMENCVKLDVGLVVDGGLGKTWYDCK